MRSLTALDNYHAVSRFHEEVGMCSQGVAYTYRAIAPNRGMGRRLLCHAACRSVPLPCTPDCTGSVLVMLADRCLAPCSDAHWSHWRAWRSSTAAESRYLASTCHSRCCVCPSRKEFESMLLVRSSTTALMVAGSASTGARLQHARGLACPAACLSLLKPARACPQLEPGKQIPGIHVPLPLLRLPVTQRV